MGPTKNAGGGNMDKCIVLDDDDVVVGSVGHGVGCSGDKNLLLCLLVARQQQQCPFWIGWVRLEHFCSDFPQ